MLLEEEDENSSCFLSSQEEQSNSARKEKLNTFNEKTDKWFKFNDTGVEEICLNENTLIGNFLNFKMEVQGLKI